MGRITTRRKRRRLRAERLEDRRLLTTLVVTSLSDNTLANLAGDGQLSLREAIEAANTDSSVDGSPAGNGPDEIVFAPGLRGEILLVNANLTITDDLTLRGPIADFDFGITIDADRMIQLFKIDDSISQAPIEVTIEGLLLKSGRVNGSGGAIENFENLTVRSTTIASSSASIAGGAIYNIGTLLLENSTIAGNTANVTGGGGIFNLGTFTSINSTIARNRTNGNGAGVHSAGGMATIISTTIAENRADANGDSNGSGGGIFTNNGATTAIYNTLLGDNDSGGFANNTIVPNDIDGASVAGTSNGNLISDPATAGGLSEGFGNFLGDGSGNRLQMGQIASGITLSRGGPTEVYELLPTSRALNAGDNNLLTTPGDDGIPGTNDNNEVALVTDQRGAPFQRSVGTVDIGSYERQALGAAFFVVNTTTDEWDYSNSDVSLREAFNSASGSIGAETITFDPTVFDAGTSNTISLTRRQLALFGLDSVTIEGPGKDALTIDGLDQSRVLYWGFDGGGDLTIRGVTITGGRTANGGFPGDGAGIRFGSTGTLTIENSSISGNTASGSGAFAGAIYSYGPVVLNNSEIRNNRANDLGGGVYTRYDLTVTDSVITGNSAGSTGGGIWAQNDTVVRRSSISDNSAGSHGGGLFVSFGNVTIVESTISGNTAGGDGGGGSGLYDWTVINSTISGNSAATIGGGIYTFGGEVTLTGSTITGNSAGTNGGGLFFDDSKTTISNSTITGNTAGGVGGGIGMLADNAGERLQINNSVIASNVDNGTAPDFLAPGTPASNLLVRNSLISNRVGTTLQESQAPDPTFSNLVGDPNGGGVIDPKLGVLSNNGGRTLTMAPLAGSPVIDRGDAILLPADTQDLDGDTDTAEALPIDQRHLARINGVVDMGSVEYYALDFGDAPDGFPVTLDDNGAHHVAVGPRLGELRDTEPDGVNSVDADRDDTTSSDDEDGVMFGTVQVGASMTGVNIDLQNATNGRVDAWIDFNGNGLWESNEQVLTAAPVVSGLQTLNIDLPSSMQPGDQAARVRLSSAGNLAPTGYSVDGEVEDYLVKILSPPKVESVVINNGDAQRSSLDKVTVTFDRVVDIDSTGEDPFQFTNRVTGAAIADTPTVSEVGGKTVVDFAFNPGTAGVTSFGSLEDGEYQLKVIASLVTFEGVPLDGDDNGSPGGDHVYSPVDEFFRKYGDFNGNKTVDLLDFAAFRATFGLEAGQAGYQDGLDSNGDNAIGLVDFAAFRANFGT